MACNRDSFTLLLLYFPQRRPGFEFEQHVGFEVDKAALGQVFSEYLRFPCQSLFQQFFFFWFVRLLALQPLLAYCASLG
jgi:hypothetical protein